MIKEFLAWIWYSSKDPRKTSLFIRAALVGVIPAVVHAVGVACGFGIVCLGVDEPFLNILIQYIEQAVFYGLGFIAVVGSIVGLIRKFWNTFMPKPE